MTRSDLIAALAIVLAAVALLRTGSDPGTEQSLPDRETALVSNGLVDGPRSIDAAALVELERRLDEQLVRVNRKLDVLDEFREGLEHQQADLLGGVPESASGADAEMDPGSNPDPSRVRPRYVAFTTPPEMEISVGQNEDGSLHIQNRNPDLAMTTVFVEAEKEDGSVEQIVLTVPPVDQ